MEFFLETKGLTDIIDVTSQIEELVRKSKVKTGACLVFCPGSTCGLTTMEYEEGLKKDIKKFLDRIVPMADNYEHCKKWGDCNGFSHIRSTLINPSLVVPVENGKLALGTWQQIVFLDFDKRPRKRKIIVKIIS